MMIHSRYVVSLERIGDAFQFHIMLEESLNIKTIQVRYLYKKDSQFIEDNLSDIKELVNFFKFKYDLHHRPITISYGPMLNKYLRTNKKRGL